MPNDQGPNTQEKKADFSTSTTSASTLTTSTLPSTSTSALTSTPSTEDSGYDEPQAPGGFSESGNNEAGQFYGALKCYFYTPKRGDIWGAFCLLFNGTTGETIENVFWVTRLLASPPIDVNLGWRELNKAIPNMGIYEKTMGDKLQTSLLEILPAHLRIELSENAGSPGYMFPLATEMRKHFERTTHYFLEVKLSFEHLSRDEMVQAGIISKDDGEADVPGDAAKNDAQPVTDTLLTCLPVIDPVRGTAVSDLNPGDVLEVRIQGGIGESEFIAPYLYPPDQNAAFPILNIEKKDDERTYVLLSVNENVKGLITVSKDLRLRTLQRRTSRGTTIIINMDNIILWGTFGLAMVVTLLVFRFLFF